MRFGPIGWIVLILFFLFSCIDQDDYDIDRVELYPSLAIPLVHGSVSLLDLINKADSAHVKIYPDGLVYFAYEEELKSQDIQELFVIPNKTVNRSIVLPPGVLPGNDKDFRTDSIVQVVDFELDPEKIDEIALRDGVLRFNTSVFPSNSPIDYEMHLVLPEFISRTTGNELNTMIKGSGAISLNDYTIFTDDNKFNLKLVLILKKHASQYVVAPGTSFNVTLNFEDFEFIYLKGFLGDQSAMLDPQEIDINPFDDILDEGEVSLAQPNIYMTVENGNGVPCKIVFSKLEARKSGFPPVQIMLSPANPVPLAYPEHIGEMATTTVTVTNVKELLDFSPDQLYYEANARINQGLTAGENFVVDTSQLIVRMGVEIPLYGHASDIQLKDTIDLDFGDADLSKINSASLKLKLVNELPLDGFVQFFLVGENYEFIDVLLPENDTHIIRGSSVNSSGELQLPGIYDGSIVLEKSKLDKIFSATHIIMIAVLQTSRDAGGNSVDVKFKSSYRLSVEAGLLTNLNLSVDL